MLRQTIEAALIFNKTRANAPSNSSQNAPLQNISQQEVQHAYLSKEQNRKTTIENHPSESTLTQQTAHFDYIFNGQRDSDIPSQDNGVVNQEETQNQQQIIQTQMFNDLDDLLKKISKVTEAKESQQKSFSQQIIEEGKSSDVSIETNLSLTKKSKQNEEEQQKESSLLSIPLLSGKSTSSKPVKIQSLFSGQVREIASSQIFSPDGERVVVGDGGRVVVGDGGRVVVGDGGGVVVGGGRVGRCVQSWVGLGGGPVIGDFRLGGILGGGTFGDVMICQHKATGTIYALKTILKTTIVQEKMIEQFALELKINYLTDHPNVVRLYTHFQDDYHVFLLLEYADSGTLLRCLKQTEDQVARIVSQVLQGVSHLHSLDIAHRDIKPENVVLCFGSVAKLCDFGWAAVVDPHIMKKTFCGTLEYVSPEMKDVGAYSKQVDLWSVGILTYQLIVGVSPLKEEIRKWKQKGGRKKQKWLWTIHYPYHVTPLARHFISILTAENPMERAQIDVAKRHLFLTINKERAQRYSDMDQLLE